MKILIDARLYGLEHAGLGRYAVSLVDQVAKIDHENQYVLLLRKKYFEELNLPKNFKKILVDYRHYSVKEQFLLPKTISEEKPDLVHFPHFNVPVFFTGRFVVTIHDLLMHKGKGKEATTLPSYLYLLKRAGYKAVFRKAALNSQKIIVPSQTVKEEVVKYYKVPEQKVVVTYEGVDGFWFGVEKSRTVLKKYNLEESQYFIYTGNAYPHKNLKRAIEAVVELNREGREVDLAIVSSRNIFTQRLEEIIRELNAQECVKLLGFVPDEELKTLYAHSLGFVYPSLSEGFGLPGLEAMASGTVSIVSLISVFKEVYKDAAIYFNPFDFTSIAAAMKLVIDFPESKRKELIHKGKELAKNYSWERMAKETLQVYNDATK